MRLAVVGLLGLSMLKGCDLDKLRKATPQVVAQEYEAAIRPYFPGVHAEALPDQEVLLAFTCIRGDGVQLLEQIEQFLPQIEEIKKLKQLRDWGPVFGVASYRYAGLAFESGVVRLNVDTWQVDRVPPWAGYARAYQTICGLNVSSGYSNMAAPSTPSNRPIPQNVWIGRFTVTVDAPSGRRFYQWKDSLGVWSSDSAFELHKAKEVVFVNSIIEDWATGQGFTFISASLDSVEKIPI